MYEQPHNKHSNQLYVLTLFWNDVYGWITFSRSWQESGVCDEQLLLE